MRKRLTKKEKKERAEEREAELVEELEGKLLAHDQENGTTYYIEEHPGNRGRAWSWSMDIGCSCCNDGIASHCQFEAPTKSGMLKKALRYAQRNAGSLGG